MKTKDLISVLADRINLSEEQVTQLLHVTTETIVAQLLDNNSVAVQGFGMWEVRKKNERVSVHPATGVRTLIPPKLALNFKQSTVLKEKLKEVRL